MTKKRLDLSRALAPLEAELYETLREILELKDQDAPVFNAAIEAFITKYGGTQYTSLDELLQISAEQAQYNASKSSLNLDELIKNLIG